ncbi:hypothetical protein GCM10020001_093270 [Nonomuraea salmonea]
MRELLRGLAASGCAVLLSSHLLYEVEQVADRIVMIGAGRVLADGTLAELSQGRTLEQTFLALTSQTFRTPRLTHSQPTTHHRTRV